MLPGAIGRAFLGILIALLAIHAHAAGPLTAEIKPLALRPRTSAPETIDVKFNWSGSGLLEGALELTFMGDGDGRPLWRSHDLALTGGAQSFRLLIPPSYQDQYGGPRDVKARFVTKTGELDLGRFDFGAQTGAERSFTICVSKPRLAARAGDFALWQGLRLERFQPPGADYKNGKAMTLPVHVETEEMPATALGYTPYDIVLLEGDGFTLLREKQLAALSRWVLAGGSVAIVTNASLETAQRKFLTDILAADVRALAPSFDATGNLEVKDEGGVIFARSGFGRLLLATAGPQSDADADAEVWRRAALFLGKVRPDKIASIGKQRTWSTPESDFVIDEQGNVRWTRPPQEMWQFTQTQPNLAGWRYTVDGNGNVVRTEAQQNLGGLLAPKQVRILPYPIMLLVLGAFLIAIGPLDWIVLGRLRLRRLTWVVFPLAAVAFTGLTVFLAGRYMGKSNYRSALTVTDLGRDGRVLRETRFELIFPARSQVVTTDVRNALCVPISYAENYYSDMKPVPSGHYEGLFPARYSLRQSLTQWTPQLNRLTSLDAGEDTSGLPWAQMDPRELNAASAMERIGDSAKWELYVVRAGKFDIVSGGSRLRELVHSICQSKETGWPRICTQFSPNGAADLADLAIGAADDSEVFATIAGRSEGDGFHIYRRLY